MEDLSYIFSKELFTEFIEVTERQKLKKYFHESDIQQLTKIIDEYGIMRKVKSQIKKCRDTKDDFLLNLAIDSNADFLITGDLYLLEIKQIHNTLIITLRELEEVISK